MKRIILLIVTMFILAGPRSALADQLLLSGSSTVQKLVLEPVQQILEKKTGVMIDSNGSGTMNGMKALMNKEVAAALSSCPLDLVFAETGVPTEGMYQEHIIHQDNVVAIVHPGNKVKSLTLAQLADIHSGRIKNWKDVGGPDSRIVVVVPPKSSGTRAFILDTVMQGASFVENAYMTVTDREAIDIVTKSPIAIAMLSDGFVRMNGKKVKTVKTPPLKRQLCIITRDDPSPALKTVIAFLKSKPAKKLFR